MPAYYDPLLFPIDSILLKGLESPGIARIRNAESKRKVDVRSAYGISATVAVWKEIAEPEVVIELRTAADWEAWADWSTATVLREMRPNKRYTQQQIGSDFALDIWHPWLDMLDIKSVIVTSVSQPVEIEPTVYAITIKFIEYRKAVQTLAKPAASKQKEQDGVDKLIDQFSEKIRKTNEELAK